MLLFNQNLLNKLISVVEDHSEECCGFIFGHEDGKYRTFTHFMKVDNVSRTDKRQSFEIASKDYLLAENFAEYNNIKLLGVYHSHPNHPAIPSEYDRIAAQPYFSYIILSVMNKKFDVIRAWNLNEKVQFFEEVPLSIIYFNQENGYRNHSNTAA